MKLSVLRPLRLLFVVALLAIGLVAAGCGSDDDDGGSSSSASTTASTTADSGAAAGGAIAVPDDIRSKGTLTVATDPTYAPNEFVERGSTTIVGMDVDLINAIAEKLGLRADVQKATFDAIIPGLAARRYDVGISSFTDTREREATVDFVTYFSAGTSFYIRRGGPDIATLEDICGEKVAVEKGTTQATDVQTQNRRCDTPADLQVYPDQNGANLAIQSGRADVGMADSPVAAYIVKQSNGAFELDGEPYGTAPYGIALPKESGLEEPIQEALRALIEDGTYLTILRRWGVEQGAITDPVINGAVD
ncbi:ABC transporter substrate-binding protein [Conexibacter sp. JD483]|uniref:ABC transporter substrate-binding protein n=1 Tax=unclassified Conexibacter TaxID=2627773 RepID=UPI00271E407C|nr:MULTISPECIES: ABC transporter substrate-binding protein [unclassified Conexibacter]MDO8188766.1 ABC transporter substrate-binding protein [Conexibacter sp. CPCC 205706]MDO8201723.1 ABC transporter substrate-binding protein [Conexibacter sp. CPCC 205762]MDR9371384.1 ABC transporter substrate-binding protein [Conexibacter sp. JD483]